MRVSFTGPFPQKLSPATCFSTVSTKMGNHISMSPFLQMDRVQYFAGRLYDSSDDGTEGTSSSKPERVSQRPRRSSCRPVSLFLILVCVFMTVNMSVVLAFFFRLSYMTYSDFFEGFW